MTDEDKNLLELAAKAAGIKYDPEASKPNPVSGAWFGLWLSYDREPTEYDRRRWNPLCDDGDALRLAVKLQLGINIPPVVDGRIEVVTFYGPIISIVEHPQNDDRNAAARRAIVRAAAEIGKAQQ